jgi:hypothetical protein
MTLAQFAISNRHPRSFDGGMHNRHENLGKFGENPDVETLGF